MGGQATKPSLVVIAGPNGAGKSTAAPKLLRDTLAVSEFVNADLNFFDLYRPLATTWRIYDNSSSLGPRCVARGANASAPLVFDEETWSRITSYVREAK